MKVEVLLSEMDDVKGMHPVIRRRLRVQSSEVNVDKDMERKDTDAGDMIVLSYAFPQGIYPMLDSFQSFHAYEARVNSEKTTSSLLIQFQPSNDALNDETGDRYIDYSFTVNLTYFTASCTQSCVSCVSSDGTCDDSNGRDSESFSLLDSLKTLGNSDTFVRHVLEEPVIYHCDTSIFDVSGGYSIDGCRALVSSGSAAEYILRIPIGSVTQQPIVAMGTNMCVSITLLALLLTFFIPRKR